MPVNIHGRNYYTVVERVEKFHGDHKNGSITTEIVKIDDKGAIFRAIVIPDVSNKERFFTGHASELFSSSAINKTSGVENAETSAIGRALACAGYAGSEFASADELAKALSQQREQQVVQPLSQSSAVQKLKTKLLTEAGGVEKIALDKLRIISTFKTKENKTVYCASFDKLTDKWAQSLLTSLEKSKERAQQYSDDEYGETEVVG